MECREEFGWAGLAGLIVKLGLERLKKYLLAPRVYVEMVAADYEFLGKKISQEIKKPCDVLDDAKAVAFRAIESRDLVE